MLRASDIRDLFERARSEMYVTPSHVVINVGNRRPGIRVKEGVFEIDVPRSLLDDPEGGPILLWYFRHDLAHLHYFPYNLRTVQMLARAAYEEVRSWAHAHNAVRLLADLQIDLFYLPLKFRQLPFHLTYEFSSKPRGIELLRYAACKHVYKEFIPNHRMDRDVAFYGSLLAEIVLSPRSYIAKVKAVATILKRLQAMGKLERLPKTAGEGIPLSEDLEHDLLAEVREVMRGLGKDEARELFRHWVKERVDFDKIKHDAEKVLEKITKQQTGKVDQRLTEEQISREPLRGEGEEPELPSKLSKPAAKVANLEELLWKAMWYRARAEEFLITYGSRRRGGTWAIYAYSDMWSVEDDIEDLDLEASFEEGPLIPEETTLKDVNVPSPSGEVLIEEQAPSVLVVLDTSRSMQGSIDDATVAAFAAYLSARRQGGRVSVLNFSTRYLVAGWDEPEIVKDLVLSLPQGELTILPLAAINAQLAELEAGESALVIIVTDCGWQNLREALGFLERIAAAGHRVVVLHIEGWKYPKSVEAVSQARGVTLYRVREPSMLKHLAVAEAERGVAIRSRT
ncbi:MAG: vWA domain-containing protein [Thermofilaceae archaeon]